MVKNFSFTCARALYSRGSYWFKFSTETSTSFLPFISADEYFGCTKARNFSKRRDLREYDYLLAKSPPPPQGHTRARILPSLRLFVYFTSCGGQMTNAVFCLNVCCSDSLKETTVILQSAAPALDRWPSRCQTSGAGPEPITGAARSSSSWRAWVAPWGWATCGGFRTTATRAAEVGTDDHLSRFRGLNWDLVVTASDISIKFKVPGLGFSFFNIYYYPFAWRLVVYERKSNGGGHSSLENNKTRKKYVRFFQVLAIETYTCFIIYIDECLL